MMYYLKKYKKLSEDKISTIKESLGLKSNDFVVLMIAELNKIRIICRLLMQWSI